MILIALGANLPSSYGSPENTLKAAIETLQKEGISIVSQSNIWITEPVPASDQPLYRNAVIRVEANKSPQELLATLHNIETEFGRVRHQRNEARVLDLDLIAYNEEVIHSQDITVPHPRMHERAFVLVPVNEVSKSWKHPVLQKKASELIALLPDQAQLENMREAA